MVNDVTFTIYLRMNVYYPETTDYEWLRAYTLLSRSGYVTEAIRECEEAWATEFNGNAAGFDSIRRLPGYQAYVQALRNILKFPLTLYRVTTAAAYDEWQVSEYSKPVAASFSREFAQVMKEVYPTDEKLVLITGVVSDPEAVLMRGRIEGSELVVNSGRVSPIQVSVIAR
jgi:hypothetical protein